MSRKGPVNETKEEIIINISRIFLFYSGKPEQTMWNSMLTFSLIKECENMLVHVSDQSCAAASIAVGNI